MDLGVERCVGSREAEDEPVEEPEGFFSTVAFLLAGRPMLDSATR